MLSKYTMILAFPSVFIFLLFAPRYRKLLAQKEIYLAFIIAIILFMPVIIWNYQHDWISFKFQFNHGVDLSKSFNLLTFTDYLGGQVLISGIFIFLALWYFMVKNFKHNLHDKKLSFLLIPCVFVLVFFGIRSVFQHMEANWPAVAYITGIIFVAYWINKVKNLWMIRGSFGLILVVMIICKAPMFFIPQTLHNNQAVKIVNTFYGTKELLAQIKPYIKQNDIVLACDYGNASRIWFYLQLPQPFVLKDFKFSHMYQYWDDTLPNQLNNAVYICDGEDQVAMETLRSHFRKIDLLYSATYDNNAGNREMYIYRVTN
ncbi:MAG: glycosyltransferase family 39 protein [Burkholderiales bacterium]|nr:glycosyltransferase family 39 protein [Burkholderiales bacterium]